MPSYQTLPLVVTRLRNGALLLKQCETITRSGVPLGKSDRTYLTQACITRSWQSRDLIRREDLWPTRDVGASGIVAAQLDDRTWPARDFRDRRHGRNLNGWSGANSSHNDSCGASRQRSVTVHRSDHIYRRCVVDQALTGLQTSTWYGLRGAGQWLARPRVTRASWARDRGAAPRASTTLSTQQEDKGQRRSHKSARNHAEEHGQLADYLLHQASCLTPRVSFVTIA